MSGSFDEPSLVMVGEVTVSEPKSKRSEERSREAFGRTGKVPVILQEEMTAPSILEGF